MINSIKMSSLYTANYPQKNERRQKLSFSSKYDAELNALKKEAENLGLDVFTSDTISSLATRIANFKKPKSFIQKISDSFSDFFDGGNYRYNNGHHY